MILVFFESLARDKSKVYKIHFRTYKYIFYTRNE